MEAFNLLHAKALYLRFCAIYGDKFVKPYHDEDFKSIWYAEWSSGLVGIDVSLIKGCLEYCKTNMEWTPSIAEFRRYCEQSSGMPSASEALQSAIRKDFHHPIIAIAYDKVGSWAMKNDKESVLAVKFQNAYAEALNQFRKNPEECNKQLEQFNERQALPEPPSKIPSQEEIIGWRERLAKYQEMAKADKAKLETKDHPEWDKNKITRGGKGYDEAYFNERKRYLIGMDEYLAGTIPREDWYDRICFLREIEGMESIKNNPPRVDVPPREKVQPRAYNGPSRAYNKWSD